MKKIKLFLVLSLVFACINLQNAVKARVQVLVPNNLVDAQETGCHPFTTPGGVIEFVPECSPMAIGLKEQQESCTVDVRQFYASQKVIKGDDPLKPIESLLREKLLPEYSLALIDSGDLTRTACRYRKNLLTDYAPPQPEVYKLINYLAACELFPYTIDVHARCFFTEKLLEAYLANPNDYTSKRAETLQALSSNIVTAKYLLDVRAKDNERLKTLRN